MCCPTKDILRDVRAEYGGICKYIDIRHINAESEYMTVFSETTTMNHITHQLTQGDGGKSLDLLKGVRALTKSAEEFARAGDLSLEAVEAVGIELARTQIIEAQDG